VPLTFPGDFVNTLNSAARAWNSFGHGDIGDGLGYSLEVAGNVAYGVGALREGSSALQSTELFQAKKISINYNYRQLWTPKLTLEMDTTFYSFKNSGHFTPGTTFEPMELWMSPDSMTGTEAVKKLSLPHPSGYDTKLTLTLPKGTTIYQPRRAWSLFGQEGGARETRSLSSITPNMYTVGPSN
jgi:hypothetical protein